ncbi:MAG: hypothetical protein MUC49_20345 [Raineya sp.]|jgi:hypothetical protein|nr:hypothetical protein [Raineya sp.]
MSYNSHNLVELLCSKQVPNIKLGLEIASNDKKFNDRKLLLTSFLNLALQHISLHDCLESTLPKDMEPLFWLETNDGFIDMVKLFRQVPYLPYCINWGDEPSNFEFYLISGNIETEYHSLTEDLLVEVFIHDYHTFIKTDNHFEEEIKQLSEDDQVQDHEELVERMNEYFLKEEKKPLEAFEEGMLKNLCDWEIRKYDNFETLLNSLTEDIEQGYFFTGTFPVFESLDILLPAFTDIIPFCPIYDEENGFLILGTTEEPEGNHTSDYFFDFIYVKRKA